MIERSRVKVVVRVRPQLVEDNVWVQPVSNTVLQTLNHRNVQEALQYEWVTWNVGLTSSQWNGPSLVQIIACHLSPSSEPVLVYCSLETSIFERSQVKFNTNWKYNWHIRKCIRIFLQNGSHFVSPLNFHMLFCFNIFSYSGSALVTVPRKNVPSDFWCSELVKLNGPNQWLSARLI